MNNSVLFFSSKITYDTDALAYISVLGSITAAQKIAINTFFKYLKDNHLYSKIIALYPKVGGTESQHKWNALNPIDSNSAYRLAYSGGWIHSSTGAKGNASNTYANTFVNLSSLSLSGDISVGYYITSRHTTTGVDYHLCGANSSSTVWIGIQYHTDRIMAVAYGGNANSYTLTASPEYVYPDGFISMSILGTSKKIWLRNKLASFSTNGSTIPNLNFWEGALNVNNTAYRPVNATIGTSFIGHGLTETEISLIRTGIENFETSLGRNV